MTLALSLLDGESLPTATESVNTAQVSGVPGFSPFVTNVDCLLLALHMMEKAVVGFSEATKEGARSAEMRVR